jgi:hypothetical protein
MEEMQNQEAPKMSSVEAEQEEFEMSHTDKLVGVFSEPSNTFEKISKFPLKTADWIIPVLVTIVVVILSQIVFMSNPTLKAELQQKQIAAMEKRMNEMVASGQMTQTQANEQMDRMNENIGQMGTIQIVSTVVGIPIVTFIVFFVVSGFFFLLAKFVLKGDGVYKGAMIAYGLPFYILVIQSIVVVIVSIAMGKVLTGINVAELLGMEKSTIGGFFLGKLDIFSIWYYVILGIGLAKIFKSVAVKKYIITVVCSWIGFSFLFWLVGKAVPFLGFLAG